MGERGGEYHTQLTADTTYSIPFKYNHPKCQWGRSTALCLKLVHLLFLSSQMMMGRGGYPTQFVAGKTSSVPFLDSKTPASSMLGPEATKLKHRLIHP